MSVTPIDRTDQRLIQLVAELGDPVVETQTLAEEADLGFQAARDRLDTLEEQGWVASQAGDGQRIWQVSSKASLLVRTDIEPPDDTDDEDIIDADEASGAETTEEVEDESEPDGDDEESEE